MQNNKNEGTGILYIFLMINALSTFIIPMVFYYLRIPQLPGYASQFTFAIPIYLLSFITIFVVYHDLKKYFPDEYSLFWLGTVFLFGAIGLFIYILLRKDFKRPIPTEKPAKVGSELICPFCKANLEPCWKICHHCKKVLPI